MVAIRLRNQTKAPTAGDRGGGGRAGKKLLFGTKAGAGATLSTAWSRRQVLRMAHLEATPKFFLRIMCKLNVAIVAKFFWKVMIEAESFTVGARVQIRVDSLQSKHEVGSEVPWKLEASFPWSESKQIFSTSYSCKPESGAEGAGFPEHHPGGRERWTKTIKTDIREH